MPHMLGLSLLNNNAVAHTIVCESVIIAHPEKIVKRRICGYRPRGTEYRIWMSRKSIDWEDGRIMNRKRIRAKVGDVFQIRIDDQRVGYGQVIARNIGLQKVGLTSVRCKTKLAHEETALGLDLVHRLLHCQKLSFESVFFTG